MKTKEERKKQKKLQRKRNNLILSINSYFLFFYILILVIFLIIISNINMKNLQEENEMLKEQIPTWKINLINCESSIEDSYGVTRISQNTTIEFSNYDKYKEWLDDFENGNYGAICEKRK